MKLGKVGIIFNGGGFTGAFGVGFIKAIWEKGIRPEHIQGISVGALSAAKLLETESIEELEKIWLDIESARASSVFNWKDIPVNIIKRASALYHNGGVLSIINKINVHKIISSPIELQIVTCNESMGKILSVFSSHDKRFKKDPELLRHVILASTSIPGIFPPVTIENEMHSDGIHFHMETMIKSGCDTIFLLLNDQSSSQRWDDRLFVIKDFLYEELVSIKLRDILQERPDFEILEGSDPDDPNPFLPPIINKIKVIGQQIKSVASSIVTGDDINFVPHRIVVMNTRTPISTLHTTGFELGDIKAAIEQGYDQASVLLKKL